MALYVAPERMPQLVAGVALAALAVWLYYLRPSSKLHRAFSIFLAFRGLLFVLMSLDGTETWSAALRDRLVVYPLIALPFLAFYAGHRFRNRFAPLGPGRTSPSPSFIPPILLAGALGVTALYIGNHGLILEATAGGFIGVLMAAEMLAYVGLAGLLFRDVHHTRLATDRRALQLVATALILEALHHATHRAILFHPFPPNPPAYAQAATVAAWIGWLVVGASAVSLVVWHVAASRRQAATDWGRSARNQALVLAAPILTGAGTALLFQVSTLGTLPFRLYLMLGGLWGAVFAGCLAYAIVRLELFHIELGLKSAMRRSTIVGIFTSVFFGAQEMSQSFIQSRTGNVWIGVLAAAALFFAMGFLQRLSHGFADRAFPGVVATPTYRQRRRDELYGALYESAIREGPLSPKQESMMADLRRRFDVPASRAKAIEEAVLGAVHGTGRPSRSKTGKRRVSATRS